MLSSTSLIMGYIAPCFKEISLLYEISSVEIMLSKMNSFDYISMKLGLIIKYHNLFMKFQHGP